MDKTSRISLSRDEYTIGWICALPIEYITARAFLDEEHNGPSSIHVSPRDNNMNRYTLGSIRGHNIVIAAPPNGEYGLSSIASVTKSLLDKFPNIRFGLLVGIGSGAPSRKHNIRLGDVIVGVSSHAECGVVQYDFEKTMQSQEFHETGSNQAPGLLHTAVTILQVPRPPGHTIKDHIHSAVYDDRWPSLRRFMQHKLYHTSADGPDIHYGLIASANTLMKDASVRDELTEKRDILCFETEAAGLMNHFPCLVIRGICDYSDSHNHQEWQGYAAVMAAAYARRLLGTIPQSEVDAQQRISIALATPNAQQEKSKPMTPSDTLLSGFLNLNRPLQEAFAPYLKDRVFRQQVEEHIGILQSNVKVRQENALSFFDSIQSAVEMDVIKGTTHSHKLMGELRGLPEPLQKHAPSYLENDAALQEVGKRLLELESNPKLRQDSALSLLDALGLAEETGATGATGATGKKGQYLLEDTKEQGNLPDEIAPTSKGDTSDPGEKASQRSIPTITTARQSLGNVCSSFFDWSSFRAHQLVATEDILQKKYLTTLALYETVKFNVSMKGNGIGLDGLARLIRHWFHKDDFLAYFRSVEREILLPVSYSEEEENHRQRLKSLDTNLFDLSKFSGFDTRLTSVTYGGSKYGTITLFELTDAAKGVPTKIRPLAAMRQVPKIIMERMGQGINGSIRTTLTMPNHKIWDVTEQKEIGRLNPPNLKPSLSSCGSDVSYSIGDGLRIAFSMDYEDAPSSKFAATIPQMVAMLHHKADIIQNIKSTPVHTTEAVEQPWVQMEADPAPSGHENNNPRVIVLAPAKGKWVEKALYWR